MIPILDEISRFTSNNYYWWSLLASGRLTRTAFGSRFFSGCSSEYSGNL